MRPSAHDTVVRSISGRPELRHATQVQEWRIEQAMDAEGFVISITAPGGESQSFFVAQTDANDIGEVLRRQAPPQPQPQPQPQPRETLSQDVWSCWQGDALPGQPILPSDRTAGS